MSSIKFQSNGNKKCFRLPFLWLSQYKQQTSMTSALPQIVATCNIILGNKKKQQTFTFKHKQLLLWIYKRPLLRHNGF